MRIAVAADHAGFELKELLLDHLKRAGHTVSDLGASSTQPCDYPDFALKTALAVSRGEAERGIVVCGSGVGASIAANKVPGVRAALCHDTYSAHQGVEHDDANVLCLGARIIGRALAFDIADAWLKARFTREDRHLKRLTKILDIERTYLKSPG